LYSLERIIFHSNKNGAKKDRSIPLPCANIATANKTIAEVKVAMVFSPVSLNVWYNARYAREKLRDFGK